jgi:hypothetical protein
MPGKGKTAYYFSSVETDVIPWTKNFVIVLAANAERWGIAAMLTFREEDRGKTVYLAGRWKTAGQKESPWSGIIFAIIP